MDFKIHNTGPTYRTQELEKASATVIEAGDLVTLDAGGLAIKAVAASTAIAFCPGGAGDWETTVDIAVDPELILSGTADANFAKANRGTEVDLVGTTTQLIDIGASTTDVLKVLPGTNAGTVGAATNVLVTINKPIF